MRIRTSHEVVNFPGYTPDVDPDARPLESVIVGYAVNPQIQCGLKSCHQWHNEGYIVKLADGGVTNVGHICGQRFGARFQEERERYLERVLRPQLLEKLSRRRDEVKPFLDEVAALAERMRLIVSRKTALFRRFPALKQELLRRAGDGRVAVTRTQRRSQQDIENLLALNPATVRESLTYEEVPVGELNGLDSFKDDVKSNVAELSARLRAFVDLVPSDEKTDSLIVWERWLDNFEAAVDGARSRVDAGERFMTTDNLRLLAELPADNATRRDLKLISVSDLDEVDVSEPVKSTSQWRPRNRRERRAAHFGRP